MFRIVRKPNEAIPKCALYKNLEKLESNCAFKIKVELKLNRGFNHTVACLLEQQKQKKKKKKSDVNLDCDPFYSFFDSDVVSSTQ